MKILPKVRTQNIIVQNLKNEVLVYDLSTDKAYNLNETVAKVFNSCDGETSFEQIKKRYKFSDDVISFALDELNSIYLLEDDFQHVSPFAGMNRREVIRKIGLASIVALPIISSLAVPTAAQAASASCIASGGQFTVTPTSGFGAAICQSPESGAQCCSQSATGTDYDPISDTALCTCD